MSYLEVNISLYLIKEVYNHEKMRMQSLCSQDLWYFENYILIRKYLYNYKAH